MNRFFSTTAILLALTTAPAFAGPIDPSYAPSGTITFGFLNFDNGLASDDQQFYDIEINGRIPLSAAFGIEYGADVGGLFGEDLNYNAYTLYGYYEVAPGQELQAGLAPSALEILLRDDRLAYGEFQTDTTLLFLTAPVAELIRRDEDESYIALRYAGEFGAIRVAASGHFNSDGDGSIYSAAARYQSVDDAVVDYWVGGGLETVESPSADNSTRTFLAGGLDFGDVDVTIEYVLGDSPIFGPDTSVVSGEVLYGPRSPGFLGDLAFAFEYTYGSANSGDFSIYGIGAEYTHESGLGVAGSFSRRESSGSLDVDQMVLEAFLTF